MSLPIACSLTAGGLADRLASFETIGRRGLIAREGATLRFRPEVREELAAVVEAERRCCPFPRLGLARGRREIVLTIAGPPEAAPLVDELADAFAAA
jgi:hypothetical protein